MDKLMLVPREPTEAMTEAEYRAKLEALVQLGAKQERAAILSFLCKRALHRVEPTIQWSFWRKALWGFRHRLWLYSASVLSDAVIAIDRGDHVPEGDE